MAKRETRQEPGVVTQTKPKEKLKKPPLYRVLFHNDDYTTMEFVVNVMEKLFYKSEKEAKQIMLQVNHKGYGVVGK